MNIHAVSENDHVRMRQGQKCRRKKKSRPGQAVHSAGCDAAETKAQLERWRRRVARNGMQMQGKGVLAAHSQRCSLSQPRGSAGADNARYNRSLAATFFFSRF